MEENMKLYEETDSDGAGSESKGGRSRKNQAKRIRTNFTEFQLRRLDEVFIVRPFPGREWINRLCEELGLSYFSIKTWFQNRRSKSRRNGTFDIDGSATLVDNETAIFPEMKTQIPYPSNETTSLITGQNCQQIHSQNMALPKSPFLSAPNSPWNIVKLEEESKEVDRFSIDAILAKQPECHFREAEGEVSVQNEANIGNGNTSSVNIVCSSPEVVLQAHERSDDKTAVNHCYIEADVYPNQITSQTIPVITEYQITNGTKCGTGVSLDIKNRCVSSDKSNDDQCSAMYGQYSDVYRQSMVYNYPWYEFHEKSHACCVQSTQDLEHETKSSLLCDLDSQQVKEVKREKLPEVHPANHHVLSWNYMY